MPNPTPSQHAEGGEMTNDSGENVPEGKNTSILYGSPAGSIEFDYVNWRGETAHRECDVRGIEFGSTKWHPEPQWLLRGRQADGSERLFAMKDMRNVSFE